MILFSTFSTFASQGQRALHPIEYGPCYFFRQTTTIVSYSKYDRDETHLLLPCSVLLGSRKQKTPTTPMPYSHCAILPAPGDEICVSRSNDMLWAISIPDVIRSRSSIHTPRVSMVSPEETCSHIHALGRKDNYILFPFIHPQARWNAPRTLFLG